MGRKSWSWVRNGLSLQRALQTWVGSVQQFTLVQGILNQAGKQICSKLKNMCTTLLTRIWQYVLHSSINCRFVADLLFIQFQFAFAPLGLTCPPHCSLSLVHQLLFSLPSTTSPWQLPWLHEPLPTVSRNSWWCWEEPCSCVLPDHWNKQAKVQPGKHSQEMIVQLWHFTFSCSGKPSINSLWET